MVFICILFEFVYACASYVAPLISFLSRNTIPAEQIDKSIIKLFINVFTYHEKNSGNPKADNKRIYA